MYRCTATPAPQCHQTGASGTDPTDHFNAFDLDPSFPVVHLELKGSGNKLCHSAAFVLSSECLSRMAHVASLAIARARPRLFHFISRSVCPKNQVHSLAMGK